MKYFEHLLAGFASILEIQSSGVRAYAAANDGFLQDRIRMRDDVRKVGKDIAGSIQKYGQSSGSGERYFQ